MVLRPFSRRMFDALLVCLNSDSWPIRDSACVPIGRVLKFLMTMSVALKDEEEEKEEKEEKGEKDEEEEKENSSYKLSELELNEVMQLITLHLQDSIYSIREHAAEAMACMLQSNCQMIAKAAYECTKKHLKSHLLRAYKQGTKEMTNVQFIPPLLLNKMKLDSSSPSLSPSSSSTLNNGNNFKQTASGWGCGLDCAVGLDCNAQRISGHTTS